MRDKKDNATFDLPGFEPGELVENVVPEPRRPGQRTRRTALKQEQIPLLDLAQTDATGLPVWCQGTAAPPSVAGLTFVGWQEPIDCGGVAVFPNDLVVVDQDGAVLVPAALIEAVVAAAVEQERLERWIMSQVEAGVALPGLYPPNEGNKARYAAWTRTEREQGSSLE